MDVCAALVFSMLFALIIGAGFILIFVVTTVSGSCSALNVFHWNFMVRICTTPLTLCGRGERMIFPSVSSAQGTDGIGIWGAGIVSEERGHNCEGKDRFL